MEPENSIQDSRKLGFPIVSISAVLELKIDDSIEKFKITPEGVFYYTKTLCRDGFCRYGGIHYYGDNIKTAINKILKKRKTNKASYLKHKNDAEALEGLLDQVYEAANLPGLEPIEKSIQKLDSPPYVSWHIYFADHSPPVSHLILYRKDTSKFKVDRSSWVTPKTALKKISLIQELIPYLADPNL